jgi:hypothetical protein
MDPNNPVVKLCIDGMQAEGEGRHDAAREFFEQAWRSRRDDYDACVAAHYLARHQTSPQAAFDWNKKALERASAVDDARVEGFYPSLYLNMGHSCETLGDLVGASNYYQMAETKLDLVPDGPYKEIVKNGIAGGHRRVDELRGQQRKDD